MSTMLKCPNPSCPYTFDPAQVPKGVVLSCPRCTMQFTLGAPPVAPVRPPAPAAPPLEPDFEVVRRAALEERDPDEPLPGRKTGGYQVFILAGIAAVLMAGTSIAIIFKILNRGGSTSSTSSGGTTLVDKDRNVSIDPLPTGWAQDDATRLRVRSPFVYGFKRESPEAYVIFGSTEYAKGRAPRSSEMKRDLEVPLKKQLFSEYAKEPVPETSWLGQKISPDHGFRFRAKSDDLVWQGEAYTATSKGIAYFWVGWCGENDFEGLKDEFKAFRGKFKLLDLRNDWRETVAKEVDYKGGTVPYVFTDAEDIWKEEPIETPKQTTPELDRWLRISHAPRADRKALTDDAELQVYILDGAGEPLDRARDFVKARWANHVKTANDELPAPTFTERTGDPEGDPLPKGETPVVRFESKVVDPADPKVVVASSESRLLVVSAARIGEKIVVVHCWCELAKRGVFEARFIQIASTLR
ncbi:hypothetical protein J8F10_08300 [Gemmata sp. G18]|uniref:Uncharacterized protein n=1 Tax=Gemmata palustris TaxID=2822762 RepID=A0ABS5BPR1_9BACT|nr:hypothetical protein [Gemmata palustris]MBP3955280.1 hypothetical protein [Gemmata palustris]